METKVLWISSDRNEGKGCLVLLVASGEETMNPKELLLSAFEDVVFLQDLVARVGLPLPMVWEVVLSLEKEGKVTYFSWRGRTVIVKRR
jgi:predicted Rossmann fold nucleotide-binding protein DprA/Smf involved in DNA uptake|uniref:DprA winged helix domain-containing protein n=1 Tax=Candidatus Caldatribacterium californiense TaxID=1454726 RepID=A0A7V4DEQ7_9BACT